MHLPNDPTSSGSHPHPTFVNPPYPDAHVPFNEADNSYRYQPQDSGTSTEPHAPPNFANPPYHDPDAPPSEASTSRRQQPRYTTEDENENHYRARNAQDSDDPDYSPRSPHSPQSRSHYHASTKKPTPQAVPVSAPATSGAPGKTVMDMPLRNGREAPPTFKGKWSEVQYFIQHYDRLLLKYNVDEPKDKCYCILDYCSTEVQAFIKASEFFQKRDWPRLRREILRCYDVDRATAQYRPGDITAYTQKTNKKVITNLSMWKKYYIRYKTMAGTLLQQNQITRPSADTYFWLGIHKDLRQVLENRILQLTAPKGGADQSGYYSMYDINQAAEWYFRRNRAEAMIMNAADYDINFDDGYSDSSDDSDADSESDDSDYDSYRRKHREKKKARKEKDKIKKRRRELSKSRSTDHVSTKSKGDERTTTLKPSGSAAEVTDLIRKINKMSLDDAEYAPTYYSILALDSTGVAAKCVKPPHVQITTQWTPNRSQTPRPALRDSTPYISAPVTTAPTPATYPNNIPVSSGPPAGRTFPDCFGCGKDDHRMRDCVEIQSLFKDGIVKNDEQTGRLCMKDGSPIRRMFGEHLAQAARRQAGPRVMFGVVDHPGEEELPYPATRTSHVAFQEFSEDSDDETESSLESSRFEEVEEDSENESNPDDIEDEGEVYLTVPRRRYQVHAADRTIPSTKTARRTAFDGVHMPRREKPAAKEIKPVAPKTAPISPKEVPHRPTFERSAGLEKKLAAGKVRDILNDVRPYEARSARESKVQDIDMPEAETAVKIPPVTVKSRRENDSTLTPPKNKYPASSKVAETAEKNTPAVRQSEIQSTVNLPKIVERILDLEVPMSVREVLVSSKELRNNLQEVIKLKNVKNVLAGAQAIPWTWSRSEGVLIKAEMEIGGRPIVAIIDTGSQLNVVRADIAALVLHRPVDMTKTTGMNDANGGRGQLRGFIQDVELSCGGVLTKTSLWVSQAAPFELLLGRPWQRNNLVTIDERDEGTYLIFKDRDTRQPWYELMAVPHEATNEVLCLQTPSARTLAVFSDESFKPKKPRLRVDTRVAEKFNTGRSSKKEMDIPEISSPASRAIPNCRCGSLTAIDLTSCTPLRSSRDASTENQTRPRSPMCEYEVLVNAVESVSARDASYASPQIEGEHPEELRHRAASTRGQTRPGIPWCEAELLGNTTNSASAEGATQVPMKEEVGQQGKRRYKRKRESENGMASIPSPDNCQHVSHHFSVCPLLLPYSMDTNPQPPALDVHQQKYNEHLDAIQRTINRLEADQLDHRPSAAQTGFGVPDRRSSAPARHIVQGIATSQDAAFRAGLPLHVRPGRAESNQVYYLGQDEHRDGQEVHRLAWMNTLVEVHDPATGEFGTHSGHMVGHLYVDPQARKKWKMHLPFPSQDRVTRYFKESKADAQVIARQKIIDKRRRLTETHQKRNSGESAAKITIPKLIAPALKARVATKMKAIAKNKLSKRTGDDAHYITHPVKVPPPCDTSSMTRIGMTPDHRNIVYRVDTDDATRLQGRLNRPGTPHPPFALLTERPVTIPFAPPTSPSPSSERSFELEWYVESIDASIPLAERRHSASYGMEVEVQDDDVPHSVPITDIDDIAIAENHPITNHREQSAEIQSRPTERRDQWDGEQQIRLPHDQLVDVNRRLAEAYRRIQHPPPRAILPLLNDAGSPLPTTTLTPSVLQSGTEATVSVDNESDVSKKSAVRTTSDQTPAAPPGITKPGAAAPTRGHDSPPVVTISAASSSTSDNSVSQGGPHSTEPTSFLFLLAEAADAVERQSDVEKASSNTARWIASDSSKSAVGIALREFSPLTELSPSPVLCPVSMEPETDEEMPELLYLDGTRPGESSPLSLSIKLPIADLPKYREGNILVPDSDSEDGELARTELDGIDDATSSEPPPTSATNGDTSSYETCSDGSGDEDGFIIVKANELVTALEDLYCVIPKPAVDEMVRALDWVQTQRWSNDLCHYQVRIDLWEDEDVLHPALTALKLLHTELPHLIDHEAMARHDLFNHEDLAMHQEREMKNVERVRLENADHRFRAETFDAISSAAGPETRRIHRAPVLPTMSDGTQPRLFSKFARMQGAVYCNAVTLFVKENFSDVNTLTQVRINLLEFLRRSALVTARRHWPFNLAALHDPAPYPLPIFTGSEQHRMRLIGDVHQSHGHHRVTEIVNDILRLRFRDTQANPILVPPGLRVHLPLQLPRPRHGMVVLLEELDPMYTEYPIFAKILRVEERDYLPLGVTAWSVVLPWIVACSVPLCLGLIAEIYLLQDNEDEDGVGFYAHIEDFFCERQYGPDEDPFHIEFPFWVDRCNFVEFWNLDEL
ncbi:hypothetical protein R3P38DRAFT_3237515 [Favolaschia claudopus]|uniref:CCHC-type domain-containing protein n=1 Tax=Favolaschia claudopus TaxID=2862362 RepID=A0AAV9ZBC2_9AGAR